MKLIGLTGGIATGKSTVSDMIRKMGIPVLDADVFSREVVEPGTFGLRTIVQTFGSDVLSGGKLDRPALGKKIFEDEPSRLVLERILHPLIQLRMSREVDKLERAGHEIVVYDAALIFEKDMKWRFDAVVAVAVPEEVQIERLVKRDKISTEEAVKKIKIQWSIEKKASLADYVIDNSGTLDQTRQRVKEFVVALQSKGNF